MKIVTFLLKAVFILGFTCLMLFLANLVAFGNQSVSEERFKEVKEMAGKDKELDSIIHNCLKDDIITNDEYKIIANRNKALEIRTKLK